MYFMSNRRSLNCHVIANSMILVLVLVLVLTLMNGLNFKPDFQKLISEYFSTSE